MQKVTASIMDACVFPLSLSGPVFTPPGYACLSHLFSKETFLSSPLKKTACSIYSVPFCLLTWSKLSIPEPQLSCLGPFSANLAPKEY